MIDSECPLQMHQLCTTNHAARQVDNIPWFPCATVFDIGVQKTCIFVSSNMINTVSPTIIENNGKKVKKRLPITNALSILIGVDNICIFL